MIVIWNIIRGWSFLFLEGGLVEFLLFVAGEEVAEEEGTDDEGYYEHLR